ncbi:MAG: PHP domain-containing protein, partial [Eubacteriaceae bacterium]
MTASETFQKIMKTNELVLESVCEKTGSGRLELLFRSNRNFSRPETDRLEMELPGLFPFASGIDIVVKRQVQTGVSETTEMPEPDFPDPGFPESAAPESVMPEPDFPEPDFEGFDSMPEPDDELYNAPVPDFPEFNSSADRVTGDITSSDSMSSRTVNPGVKPEAAEKAAELQGQSELQKPEDDEDEHHPDETETGANEHQIPDWQKARMQKMMARIEKQTLEHQKNDQSSEPEQYQHRPGMVLCGKTIKNAVIPMKELDMTSESQVNDITVCGEILKAEVVDISDKTVLFKFNITDKTNSISCKKFIQKNKEGMAERMEQALVPGACFTIRGKLVYDNYERQKLMDVQDIVCAPVVKRTDNAETKRVELHMHTQYSAMDAVSKVSDIMARARDFGHDAVGITDHGVLQAFPEVQILAKKYGIKALYGVEGYLVDGGRPVVTCGTLGTDQNFDGEFVFFDLETTG